MPGNRHFYREQRAAMLAAEKGMSLNRWLAAAVARETGLAERVAG